MPTLLHKKPAKPKKDIVIPRQDLGKAKLDAGGRDFLIGFNEPAFRFSRNGLEEGDLDSKLNARLVSYFLPAVEVARKQDARPRLYLVSALNIALKWNAKNDRQKKIMMIDNNLKMDFLRSFLEHFLMMIFR